MYDDVIYLLSQTHDADEVGDSVPTETRKEVFAAIKSISQSEFYQASAQGLKPEIKFVLADYYDYDGQKEVLYDHHRYTVLRTYRNGIQMELVCVGGVNSASTQVGDQV